MRVLASRALETAISSTATEGNPMLRPIWPGAMDVIVDQRAFGGAAREADGQNGQRMQSFLVALRRKTLTLFWRRSARAARAPVSSTDHMPSRS